MLTNSLRTNDTLGFDRTGRRPPQSAVLLDDESTRSLRSAPRLGRDRRHGRDISIQYGEATRSGVGWRGRRDRASDAMRENRIPLLWLTSLAGRPRAGRSPGWRDPCRGLVPIDPERLPPQADLRAGRTRILRMARAAPSRAGDLFLFRSRAVSGRFRARRRGWSVRAEAVLRRHGAVGHRAQAGGADREWRLR